MKLTQVQWTSHECQFAPFCWEAGCSPSAILTVHEVTFWARLLHRLGIRPVFEQHRLDADAMYDFLASKRPPPGSE